MVVVEIMFKIILVAVPAFILVDPVIISGPVSIQIKVLTLVIKWGEGLVTRYTVLAKTVYLVTNPSPHLMTNVNTLICIDTGPEIITGSTRMKAGTATKMILNMISTTTMIKLGKVYGNLMVDLMAIRSTIKLP